MRLTTEADGVIMQEICRTYVWFLRSKSMGYEVDFLAVGDGEKSGDAIAMRFGNLSSGNYDEQTVVVIDGGFRENGGALVDHIRTLYHTDHVDLVVSTHSDADHAGGLEVVLEQLEVDCLWMHRPWNHTDDIAKMFKDGRVTDKSVRTALRKSLNTAHNLERIAEAKGIPIVEPFAEVQDDSERVTVIGPTKKYYEGLLPDFHPTPEPKVSKLKKAVSEARELVYKVAETWNFETLDDTDGTSAENNSSAILLVKADEQHLLLFTGDAGIPALTKAAELMESVGFDLTKVSFIQVPHHGSKRNVGPSILDRIIGPKLAKDERKKTAFVSASRDGLPKHPAKKVTNAFRRRGAYVFATRGQAQWHHRDAPEREGWTTATPLPFYDEVEE